jgi:hypothetical protein
MTDGECVLSLSNDLTLFIDVQHLLLFDGPICLNAKSVFKATDRTEAIVNAVVHAFTEVSATIVEIAKMATTATAPVVHIATPTAATTPVIHIATAATTTVTPIIHVTTTTTIAAAPVVAVHIAAASATPVITIHVAASATTPVIAAGPTAALSRLEQIVQ